MLCRETKWNNVIEGDLLDSLSCGVREKESELETQIW